MSDTEELDDLKINEETKIQCLDDLTQLKLWHTFYSQHFLDSIHFLILPQVVLINCVEVIIAPFLSLVPFKSRLVQTFQFLHGDKRELSLDGGDPLSHDNQLSILLNQINFSFLTTLDLVKFSLDMINQTSWERLSHVTRLNLSNNKLTSNPNFIRYMSSLTHLTIQHNPKEGSHTWDTSYLSSLSHLRSIDFQNNLLDKKTVGRLAETLMHCTGVLESLDISHNLVGGIPSSILSLTSLKNLNVSFNQIDVIPMDIDNMVNLEVCRNINSHISLLFTQLNTNQHRSLSSHTTRSMPHLANFSFYLNSDTWISVIIV
eukprot:TRINITY_DN5476_c0_g2_i2.p1 TRINITY_DN5476_c0_g2~~TRINITY_DN5476_c0_g2_i2.p1  ORF type:complete len:317 (+),score=41.93 TRINITY_DN5476_c0_g2_i2:102-1052(+)